MFAPIRPSPIIPSCMEISPPSASREALDRVPSSSSDANPVPSDAACARAWSGRCRGAPRHLRASRSSRSPAGCGGARRPRAKAIRRRARRASRGGASTASGRFSARIVVAAREHERALERVRRARARCPATRRLRSRRARRARASAAAAGGARRAPRADARRARADPRRRSRSGGSGHRDDGEPEEEIVAEAARAHLGLEIAVGRREDPRVDLARVRVADALEAPLLEEAQELRLELGRRARRPRRGRPCPPAAASSRPGLSFHAPVNAPFTCPNSSLSSRCSASVVHAMVTNGSPRRGLQRVDRAREHVLARAALAEQQHRDVRLGGAPRGVERAVHHRRAAESSSGGSSSARRSARLSRRRARHLENALDEQADLVERERLHEVVERALAHRLDGPGTVAYAVISTTTASGCAAAARAAATGRRDPPCARRRARDRPAPPRASAQRFDAVRGHDHAVPEPAQVGRQVAPDVLLVVDDEDLAHGERIVLARKVTRAARS